MKNKQKIIYDIKKIKSYIQSNYDVEKIGVFGSYINGVPKEGSDLDVLIDLKNDSKISLLGLSVLENFLSENLGIKVDLVVKEDLKPTIGRRILKEVVYV